MLNYKVWEGNDPDGYAWDHPGVRVYCTNDHEIDWQPRVDEANRTRTTSAHTQFTEDDRRRFNALLESFAWGDVDLHLRSFEDALRRAVEATRTHADRWEAQLVDHYEDEFSVSDDAPAAMSETELLAYVGRLVRTLAMIYGAAGGWDDAEAVGQEDAGSLAALLTTAAAFREADGSSSTSAP